MSKYTLPSLKFIIIWINESSIFDSDKIKEILIKPNSELNNIWPAVELFSQLSNLTSKLSSIKK